MSRPRAVLLLCLVLGPLAVWFSLQRTHETANRPEKEREVAPFRARANPPDPESERAVRDSTASRTLENDWADLLVWLDSEPRPSDSEIREKLLALRVSWTEKDFQVLAQTLTRLLESGEDRNLGLAFRVGPHGFLQSWPTLRVFLLDVLAASDPELAAATARSVIAKTESADEFAVSLRSLTRKGLARASDEELLTHFQTLLGRSEWKNSGGFGEAFDLPRLLGTTAAAEALARWEGNPKLRNRALDEFSADHPAEGIELVQAGTPLEPAARAMLMARADPADAAQLTAVDQYLRDPSRQAGEINAFLESFPLRSATTGYRLYGKHPAPYTFETITAGDRAALQQVTRWMEDPALEAHRGELASLKERLEEWVNQAR